MLPSPAKEDLVYKAPLTATVVSDFLSTFQSLHKTHRDSNEPFVYVDQNGVKLVTNVVDEHVNGDDGIFALSIAGDGWMEMLAIHD